MFTLIGVIIGCVIAIGVVLVTTERHDHTIIQEQRRVIMQFQDILSDRLEEYNPRIQVWLVKNDAWLQPHAMISAQGHLFVTRSSSDAADMRARADEAADFFDKKQLMKWIPND